MARTIDEALREKDYSPGFEKVQDYIGVPLMVTDYEVNQTEFGEALTIYAQTEDGVEHQLSTWSENLLNELRLVHDMLPLDAAIYLYGKMYTFYKPRRAQVNQKV